MLSGDLVRFHAWTLKIHHPPRIQFPLLTRTLS